MIFMSFNVGGPFLLFEARTAPSVIYHSLSMLVHGVLCFDKHSRQFFVLQAFRLRDKDVRKWDLALSFVLRVYFCVCNCRPMRLECPRVGQLRILGHEAAKRPCKSQQVVAEFPNYCLVGGAKGLIISCYVSSWQGNGGRPVIQRS